ncbi:MAG: flagellar basal body rod protein FlgC [Caulobacteraceae bacterium]|nr:flagellar basal body rod protein FlgC [Caulobacteraceae bacterium]
MADSSSPAAGMMAVAASAMQAQQARMRIIAENLANADSVSKSAGGDPYRRQVPVFTPVTLPDGEQGVSLTRVAQDQTAFRTQYQPGHPSADAKGYVKLPNVDPMVEALDMREAQRAYQANLTVIETFKTMESDTIAVLNK